MKKILLSTVILFAGFSLLNAQDGHFKAGVHTGLPVGNLSEGYSFNLGLDVAYLWNVNEIIELGVATGFSNYFGKNFSYAYDEYSYEFKADDLQIIPLAATAKFKVAKNFFVGTDLGYAFFLNVEDVTGALYYQPKVGMDFKKSEVYLGYKGMSKDGEGVGSINLGYAYNF